MICGFIIYFVNCKHKITVCNVYHDYHAITSNVLHATKSACGGPKYSRWIIYRLRTKIGSIDPRENNWNKWLLPVFKYIVQWPELCNNVCDSLLIKWRCGEPHFFATDCRFCFDFFILYKKKQNLGILSSIRDQRTKTQDKGTAVKQQRSPIPADILNPYFSLYNHRD